MVDDETREPVELQDKARSYEYEKGQYVLVEDEQIDDLQVESSHTIEIDLAVIQEAMNGKGMVGLGQVVLSKRIRHIGRTIIGLPRNAGRNKHPHDALKLFQSTRAIGVGFDRMPIDW